MKYAGESINIDDEILENVDTEKFGKKKSKHYIRYRTKNMYNTFFKDESVIVQVQPLLCLISVFGAPILTSDICFQTSLC